MTNPSSNRDSDGHISAWISWYSRKLDTHPMTTKCLTSGLISASGDILCQYLTQPSPDGSSDQQNWDLARTGRFAALGAVWVGPVLHYWYGALFRAFPRQVVLRVAVDQLLFAPAFLVTFLSWLWTLEGDKSTTLLPRLKENVPSIVVANWSLWVPAQAANFYFIQPKYHVLFSNVVALVWNAYLSYSSH